MAISIVSIDEKVSAIESEILRARKSDRPSGSPNQRYYETLKAIVLDLRARQQMPTNNALGQLRRALEAMRDAPRAAGGYDHAAMIEVAAVVIRKWHTISQALEQFGDESAE